MCKIIKKKVRIEKSRFGKGLFADETILSKSVILCFTGEFVTFQDTLQMGESECYPVQIDDNKYIDLGEPAKFINHSCTPNCGLNERLELIAITTIKHGEELFWDYSTSMLERGWKMQCGCGEPHCRQVIQDFDFLPNSIQEKYIAINIVQPYILKNLYD
jgi:uncharacterized protein